MSEPTYWSQPNQQVVRDGEPVGIIDDSPDPQVHEDTDDDETGSKSKKAKSSK